MPVLFSSSNTQDRTGGELSNDMADKEENTLGTLPFLFLGSKMQTSFGCLVMPPDWDGIPMM